MMRIQWRVVSLEAMGRAPDSRELYQIGIHLWKCRSRTTACYRCGQVLGAVTYTKRGEPGVWCSKQCRDGGVKERGGEK